MSDRIKSFIKIGVIVSYIIFIIVFTISLPNILSLGRPEVRNVLSSGQTAAIIQRDIKISESTKAIKAGDKIYLTSGVNGRVIASHKKSEGAQEATVIDSKGADLRVQIYYREDNDRGVPGIGFFQFIVFASFIIFPIVILAKNDKLDVLNLGFLADILPSSNSGGGKYKYGNQGTAKKGSVSELKGLTGSDGLVLSKKVRLSAGTSYEHLMVLGPTGSGKSSALFIPNLLDIDGNHSAVLTDPKREMYDLTKDYLISIGYNIVKLEPLNPKNNEFYYNPILIAEDDTEIRQIAQLILTNGNKATEAMTGSSSGGAEWITMSIPLFAAAIAYVKEYGETLTIKEAIEIILTKKLEDMEKMFKKSQKAYKLFLTFKASAESEKTMSSIKTVLASNVTLFSDDKIEEFTKTPFEYDENGKKVPKKSALFDPRVLREKPTVLFICVPENKADYMMPLMSVFFTQLLDMTTNISTGHPIFFLLDEFANIGVLPTIAKVAATARSRRIGLALGIQTIDQLERNYGRENAQDLMNNLKTRLVFAGCSGNSAQYISDLAGSTTIETTNVSQGGGGQGQDLISSMIGSKNISKSGTRRELYTVDEIRRLPEDEVLIIANNRNPVQDKKNKYFKESKYKGRYTPRQ